MWEWQKGRPRLKYKSRDTKDLVLKELKTGKKITIPRLEAGTAEKRLGVYYAIEGHWRKEFNTLLEYTEKFATRLSVSRLDRCSGYHAYHALWLAKYRYSAEVVCFSNRQMKMIERKIVGPSLSAAGYSYKMPRTVVFGLEKFGGMGWDNPYSVTILEKVKIILGSIRRQDTVGQLLQIQLTWLQLVTGSRTPVLEHDAQLSYLPKSWLQHRHRLLSINNIQLKIEGQCTPRAQRQEDRVIMDYVMQHLPLSRLEIAG